MGGSMARISYQFDEHSCALAALRTLSVILTKKRGWKNLTFDTHPPYSLETLEKEMSEYGFDLRFYQSEKQSFDYPSKDKKPFLALLSEKDKTHMVVVKKITEEKVIYLDPSSGKEVAKKEHFIALWTGLWGEMTERAETPPPKADRIVPIWEEIIVDGLLFVTEICLGLGLAFLDKTPLWLTLCCMGLALLFEEGRRLFILMAIRSFDKKYLNDVYDDEPKRMRTNYERFCGLKKNLFADASAVVSQVMTSLLIAAIVGMNSPSFFLSLGVVLALLCGEKLIFNRYFSSKRIRMQKEEKILFESYEESEKRQLLFSLSKDADRYGKMMLLERSILTITVGIFSLLPSIMANDSSLNYYLFHLFALLFIQKGGSDVFDYAFGKREREINALYFKEYISKKRR